MLDQIGQMIISGIEGTTLSSEEAQFLEKEDIGGVILFEKNYESPMQLANLVNSIQKLRRNYPLFVAVDHEGGRIIRFKKDFTQFPPMLNVAEFESPKLFFQIAQIMGRELHACGVNLNMTPCCDVLTNSANQVIGDRAFGKSAKTVAKFISAIIRGFQTTKVITCAKHFPGHGSSFEDSHLTLPVVDTPLEVLEGREFIPFVKAIKSRVPMIMMAHLLIPGIDDKFPSTLSKKTHDLLRAKLKYNRIIISDDMQMNAIRNNYQIDEAAIMAINAGTDIIEYRDFDQAKKALDALKSAIEKKQIKKQTIKPALERIYSCKKTLLSDYTPVNIQEVKKRIGTGIAKSLLDNIEKRISS
ncbi:MAG: beta-N-acetylhexosaminidase [Halobacteriovoraceae bacterium]|nr:beta-N-acetylhexosaminidase [Halobacteriovoraceae bacterium]